MWFLGFCFIGSVLFVEDYELKKSESMSSKVLIN